MAIMEALAFAERDGDGSGMPAQRIVELAGLPVSTGYRILAEMRELGLIYRANDRKLLPNFSFERRVRKPGVISERLAEACATLSQKLTSASEIVVLSGQSLLWHIVTQHPEQDIRLRAYRGYLRATQELDSITRLALAHVPTAEIEKNWDRNAFYSAGLERRQLDWATVNRTIAEVDLGEMQYDMMGNAKGVRRFCIAVHGDDGELACILTVAEAAIPVLDERAHAAAIRRLLMEERSRIEGKNGDMAMVG
ncbi:helix-turn-helix domain-containing protein [Pararhizobium mangrovi]|nr:helix-turn-helix domain-containing protein [Pararhizobium mangrovi]